MSADLRDILTGGALRVMMGLGDAGESAVGVVEHPEGATPAEVDSGRLDVWIWAKDLLRGTFVRGRLFLPMTVLFRLPAAGESCMILRPRDCGENGEPYILVGDGGASNAVPSWLAGAVWGLSHAGELRVESTDAAVKMTANGGSSDIVLNNGTLEMARDTDPVNAGALSGTAGPWPVLFTHVDAKTGVTTAGQSVNLTGKITDGATHIKG